MDACKLMAAYILAGLYGWPKERMLEPSALDEWLPKGPLTPKIGAILNGSYKEKEPPAIKGSGYVVSSLEAAMWAFYKTDGFEDGVLMAVNLGDDADTTGAVYGQIAGAYYGYDGIPARWRNKVAMRTFIESFAENLYRKATTSLQ